ncbi:hypothetical protein GCM10017044_10220 [Kordiimonas sediminis]|uniref:DNA gyrase inhibitor YacG n=1 Tax=Kordiimonas sediminis TaxID=1735581 RepID=A0A919ANH8_9PROT|nr:DNA gyrase inhibitor YacG [Kordiimonas sediminis]GHF17749.1 hypothetical protein GCM10017044_10220 [Kordiimonas sediminis]
MTDHAAPAKCPQCDKPVDPKYRPFCSKRCADLDLGKWLNEEYVLPGNAPVEGIDPGDREA